MTREECDAALVEAYPVLRKVALKNLRDEQNAEEVVHQTIDEILRLRSYETFEQKGQSAKAKASFKTYIIKRLEWRCDDFFKSLKAPSHENMSTTATLYVEEVEENFQALALIDRDELSVVSEDQDYTRGAQKKRVALARQVRIAEVQVTMENAIAKALDLLPSDLRQVIELTVLDGLTEQEAGKELALSRDQVARKKKKAKEALRHFLTDYAVLRRM